MQENHENRKRRLNFSSHFPSTLLYGSFYAEQALKQALSAGAFPASCQ